MVFRKVLIGFAFSPNLKANIFEAARLALQFDAEIIFLHVGEKTTQKEQEFEQLLASLPKGPKKQSVVWKVGSPNDVIVATCEKEKVDLLLLGALKRENMLRYYLGSIARKVTRKAPCSVLLMLHPSVERIPCQHMVVNGFDSPHTQHTVEKAYEVAQALKTQKITLVEEINRSEIKIAVSDDRSLRQATLRKQKLNRQEERRVQDILKEIPETKKQGIKTQISYNILATPRRIAVCVSCPHACITGTFSPLYSPVIFDFHGRSARSLTGRPSISALKATTGPGFPPFKTATTPVFATLVCGVKPISVRILAIFSAVLYSLLLNSAF